ncbi:hypothetical protein GCM10010988_40370 [Cnuibacter physcomitrellae]|uniref:MobC family plasmid mobilization relaxosome protein n=1 Tax=Cnuibacter physcomitrellae TaxID=1619308 RepID=UPI0019CB5498|nr:hypothetical protein GCM10010988_40370 [Cnuibacter physcomitrellae]
MGAGSLRWRGLELLVRRSQLFGRSRRENSESPRDKRYVVYVNAEEQAALEARAVVAGGITVPRLLVESAMNANVQTRSDVRKFIAGVFELQDGLAAIGNNVNQIAKYANTERVYPSDAEATFEEVRRVARLIEATVQSWDLT